MHILLGSNPQYRNTVIFPSGVELSVPDIPENIPENLPPWLR